MDWRSKEPPATNLDEVQRDAESLLQHAQLASSEVESLKEQLAAEKKTVWVVSMELEELKKELEESKIEAEKLRFMEKRFEDRYVRPKLRMELEDANDTIAELREEVAYKSSVNRSLRLQLEKTIESNSELLLEIKDLDGLLQSREKEIEELRAETRERQKEQSYEDVKVWMQKVEERELEIEKLKGIISKLEEAWIEQKRNRADGDLLKRELEKTETELAEISRENMNLMSQLMELRRQTEVKEALVEELELKLQELSSSLAVHQGLETTVKEHKEFMIFSNLESNKLFAEDLSSTMEELRVRNEQLEAHHKSLEERMSCLMEELNVQRKENLEHEKERSLLMLQRGQLKTLREKIATLTESYEAAKERAEGLEVAKEVLSKETSIALDSLEQQLKDRQDKLQEQLRNVEQSHAHTMQQLQARDLEVKQLTESLEVIKSQLQKAYEKLLESEVTAPAMEEKLQGIPKENEYQTSHIVDLQLQLSSTEEKLHVSSKSLSALEQHVQTLQDQKDELAEMLRTSMSLQEEVASRLESLQAREIELQQELQEKVQALCILKGEMAAWHRAMAELKDEVQLLEDDEMAASLKERKEEDPCKILRAQLEGFKASIHTMKLEKERTETSLQQLQLDNARLRELTTWKEKVEIVDEEHGTSKKGKNKARTQEVFQSINKGMSNAISMEERDFHSKGATKRVDADQKSEVTKLRKLAADLRRKLLEQEEERDDTRKKLALLQKEVQRKSELLILTEKKVKERERERISHKTQAKFPANTTRKMGMVANSSIPQGAKEAMADLMERIKALERELHIKTVELEAAKFVLKGREVGDAGTSEKEMIDPVEEHAHIPNKANEGVQDEDVEKSGIDTSEDTNKGRDDTSEADNQRVQDEDLYKVGINTSEADNQRVQDEDAYKDTSEADNRVIQDEDVNKIGVDTSEAVVESLPLPCEGTGFDLQEELREVKERYSEMSLRFAELQAEKEELLATIKNLRRENFNMVFLQRKTPPRKLSK